jgi:hypothetical protein
MNINGKNYTEDNNGDLVVNNHDPIAQLNAELAEYEAELRAETMQAQHDHDDYDMAHAEMFELELHELYKLHILRELND